MNQNIVNQYDMSFQNQILDSELTGKKNIIKVVSTNNSYLTSFLFDWYSALEIDELLLPDIEEALTNTGAEVENGSALIYIYIYI